MSWSIGQGDCLEAMRAMEPESVDCVVTSPPYWGLRDYGVADAWGLEPSLAEYLGRMRSLGSELMRVLKPSGTFWLNMGDAYAANRTYQVTDNKHTDVGNNGAARVPAVAGPGGASGAGERAGLRRLNRASGACYNRSDG